MSNHEQSASSTYTTNAERLALLRSQEPVDIGQYSSLVKNARQLMDTCIQCGDHGVLEEIKCYLDVLASNCPDLHEKSLEYTKKMIIVCVWTIEDFGPDSIESQSAKAHKEALRKIFPQAYGSITPEDLRRDTYEDLLAMEPSLEEPACVTEEQV